MDKIREEIFCHLKSKFPYAETNLIEEIAQITTNSIKISCTFGVPIVTPLQKWCKIAEELLKKRLSEPK